MKTILTLAIFAVCLTISQIACVARDRNAQIKAQMVENYLLWQEAYKLRDAEHIISFESPDFTWVTQDGRGRRPKEEADERMRASMKATQKVHDVRVEIKKLTIEPHRVVVLIKQHADVNGVGNAGNGDRLFRFTSIVEARDIWVEYDRVWMLKRREYALKKMEISFVDQAS